MNKIFDYIFFRTYSFYEKKGSDISVARGVNLVSIIQGSFILALIMIIDFRFDIIDRRYVNKYTLGLPLAIFIIVINHIRYTRMGKRNQFKPLYERWENEDRVGRIWKGILIVLAFPIFLFGVPMILWSVKHFF
jgi:hypothetical protein